MSHFLELYCLLPMVRIARLDRLEEAAIGDTRGLEEKR